MDKKIYMPHLFRRLRKDETIELFISRFQVVGSITTMELANETFVFHKISHSFPCPPSTISAIKDERKTYHLLLEDWASLDHGW